MVCLWYKTQDIMAEEDEIDILGDFSLDNLLCKSDTGVFAESSLVSQNSDLLKCDYTIHPQWLLDKPSANPALWYNTNSDFAAGLTEHSVLESINNDQVCTENSINDESGWTEKEKNLLNRGIEIFGRSNVRLSQFIGSKSPAEVKYFLKNFYSDVQVSYRDLNNDIIFDNNCKEHICITSSNVESVVGNDTILHDADSNNYLYNCYYDNKSEDKVNKLDHSMKKSQIPSSIEEVIAVVSTATTTVSTNLKKSKFNNVKIDSNNIGRESHSKNIFLKNSCKVEKFKNTVKHKTKFRADKSINGNISSKKAAKFKFITGNVKMLKDKSIKRNIKRPKKKMKSNVALKTELENADVIINKAKAPNVAFCKGEQVIKIRKESVRSDSDVEVDVEDFDDSDDIPTIQEQKKIKEDFISVIADEKDLLKMEDIKSITDLKNTTVLRQQKIPELSELDDCLVNELMNKEIPKSEYVFVENEITNLEKFVHYEFFEGRPTKTPGRYIKIRNHILNTWKNIKPTYVTKTSIRQGLKQCGDVNCIGRIHQFLEQIGAINFNCAQTNYIRPLYDVIVTNYSMPKKKVTKDVETLSSQKLEIYRARNKKKYIIDGEGGCTLTHNESGDVINTTVVNEEPIQKQKTHLSKPVVRLIYCRPFEKDHPQEYTIQLNLSVLLLMDLHAHTSLSEVMGLVGGRWDKKRKVLTITRYEPCKNIAASSTHCDMCPISQAKATEILHGENLDVLGWYHSHPTFAPEPSQQDIDTQMSVQQWIGNDKPCVGFILTPFSAHGALIASPYRCMIVDKKANFEDQFVPYKFKVDLVSTNFNMDNFLSYAWRIFNSEFVGLKEYKVNIYEPYFQDHSLSYLEKFITSIKMHLAKCSNINKMTCDAIVQGLWDICRNNL